MLTAYGIRPRRMVHRELNAVTIVALIGVVLGLVGADSSAARVGGWHVVASRTVRGGVATTAVGASVQHPRALAAEVIGGSGLATWTCARGSATRHWRHSWRGGLYRLPHVAGARRCRVGVSGLGPVEITVKILAR